MIRQLFDQSWRLIRDLEPLQVLPKALVAIPPSLDNGGTSSEEVRLMRAKLRTWRHANFLAQRKLRSKTRHTVDTLQGLRKP